MQKSLAVQLWPLGKKRLVDVPYSISVVPVIRPLATRSSTALAAFGHIDMLVNKAGIFIASPFTDYTEDQYRAKLATNLDGFFFIIQPAIAAMEKQGSGHVVQITTTLADQAVPVFSAGIDLTVA